jgi:hypothetical protein
MWELHIGQKLSQVRCPTVFDMECERLPISSKPAYCSGVLRCDLLMFFNPDAPQFTAMPWPLCACTLFAFVFLQEVLRAVVSSSIAKIQNRPCYSLGTTCSRSQSLQLCI